MSIQSEDSGVNYTMGLYWWNNSTSTKTLVLWSDSVVALKGSDGNQLKVFAQTIIISVVLLMSLY